MVRSILQDVKLVREVWSDPLHGMTEQMQQEKTLHLEIDVGVDDDPQTIEDPVRGASRSRYSITKPYLTIPDDTRLHRFTMSPLGNCPTSRAPTSS
jgi:hypothetical protein